MSSTSLRSRVLVPKRAAVELPRTHSDWHPRVNKLVQRRALSMTMVTSTRRAPKRGKALPVSVTMRLAATHVTPHRAPRERCSLARDREGSRRRGGHRGERALLNLWPHGCKFGPGATVEPVRAGQIGKDLEGEQKPMEG